MSCREHVGWSVVRVQHSPPSGPWTRSGPRTRHLCRCVNIGPMPSIGVGMRSDGALARVWECAAHCNWQVAWIRGTLFNAVSSAVACAASIGVKAERSGWGHGCRWTSPPERRACTSLGVGMDSGGWQEIAGHRGYWRRAAWRAVRDVVEPASPRRRGPPLSNTREVATAATRSQATVPAALPEPRPDAIIAGDWTGADVVRASGPAPRSVVRPSRASRGPQT